MVKKARNHFGEFRSCSCRQLEKKKGVFERGIELQAFLSFCAASGATKSWYDLHLAALGRG